MTPTNKLRFVERDCYIKNGEAFRHPFKQRVLQQQWVNDLLEPTETEWRDVPLEVEGVDDEERRREKERLMSGIL